MKIAIFHDYFDEIGGAEITLLYLSRSLDATIFTTNINHGKINSLGFSDIKMVSLGKVPNFQPFKNYLTSYIFLRARVKGFDAYLFGGSLSLLASKANKPNLWYVVSFPRGLYQENIPKGLFNFFWKFLDQRAVRNIKVIISNSKNTSLKIKKFYQRKSKVIYHPTNLSQYSTNKSKNYWLCINRIDPYKRNELQINAFSRLPSENLIIVGGPASKYKNYYKKLKETAPKNVKFLGGIYCPKDLKKLYSECKGFIATARDEDFGMTPVEAMASGKPVIAVNEGGYKESVIHGKTGRLISSDVGSLVEAIKEVSQELKNKPFKYKDACQKRAREFRVEDFIEKIKKEINEKCLKN